MSKHIIIAVAALVGCGVAGILLAPTHEEIALMKLQDNHFHDALDHYMALQSHGDTSINVLSPLVKLHVHYGHIDEAIALANEFVAKHPRSADGHKLLSELYKSSQRFNHYCRELEILQTLAPKTAYLRDLADTYDFLGQYPQEMQALERLTAARDYRPKEDDYVKLASFYRINGQLDQAAKTATAIIDIKQNDVHIDTIGLAMQLLLKNGDNSKAFAVASGYVAKTKKEKDAIELAAMLRDRGQLDSAYALLTPFLPNIDHSPELLQQLVTLQLAQGKNKEAYDLLSGQYAKGVLTADLTVTLIDLAAKFKDYALWEELIRKVPLEELSEDVLVRYADMAVQMKRPEMAEMIQKRLGPQYLHDTPVLAAVLACIINDTPQAMAALLALSPHDITIPEEKMIVANLYFHRGYPQRALALFEGAPVTTLLGILDPMEVAMLYLNAGESAKAEQALAAARPDAAPAMQARIDQSLWFMAIGKGDMKAAQNPAVGRDVLANGYDMAVRYHHPDIALAFAEAMYKADPSVKNRMQLADALMGSHRYADAINNLQTMVDSDPAARAQYMDAMAQWIHQAGIGALGSNRKTLDSVISSTMSHADMSLPERRSLAYLLQESGFSDKAEGIFFDLAANQPYGSPDVTEILNFWGERLTPRALSWIESRARAASGDEKARWLRHLNDTNHPQGVLAVVQEGQGLTPAVADQYIDALAALHDDQRLARVLTDEISHESGSARLEHLTNVAEGENLSAVAEKGWRQLYASDSGNSKAAKELGLLAFNQNHYTQAKPLLEQYLQANAGNPASDYRVTSAYAEIMQHLKKKNEATTYFAEAEKQLSEIKGKDKTTLLDEAHLLYRTDHLQQSLDLYRSLLKRYPQDKNIRADFAEVLIETKQYDEASLILQ